MRHEDAIENHAVERYLLREMTEDEQGIFEEHFFDCLDCAADVTDGTRMMMAGKAVVAEERRTSTVVRMLTPRPLRWLPAAAAAALAFTLLGYILAPRQHDPTQIVNVLSVETGFSRAGTPVEIPTVRPGDGLKFDVVPSDDAVEYAAVVTCGGKTESTESISREMAADAVILRIGELPAGRCELVVQGVRKDGKHFWITSSPFKVGER
jgi:hypothetical protein